MTTSIKIVQRTLDDLNEELLAQTRKDVEVTAYTNLSTGRVCCQMFMKNGTVIEGYAFRTKFSDGKMDARRAALKLVILIEQYMAAERLYQETLTQTNAG